MPTGEDGMPSIYRPDIDGTSSIGTACSSPRGYRINQEMTVGVSIDLKCAGKWIDITPGWRSQMASWLREIGGERDVIAFTKADIPALRHRQEVQAEGRDPPFHESDEWTECFERIIETIKDEDVALVRMQW